MPKGDHGCDLRLFDTSIAVQWVVDSEDPVPNNNFSSNRKKRKAAIGTIQIDESDEEDYFSPPVNDIYRLRQQKKVK